MSAVLKAVDPPLGAQELIALLGALLQKDGGQIDVGNAAIYFDEEWEELEEEIIDRFGNTKTVAKNYPSFVCEKLVNGKRVKTAHPTLTHALRELE